MAQRGGKRPVKTRGKAPTLREAGTNGDQKEREVQAPKEVEGPNTPPPGMEQIIENYPFVQGYICVPEQLYDMMVDVIFSLPYAQVGRLAPQMENLSQIHKALKETRQNDLPGADDET